MKIKSIVLSFVLIATMSGCAVMNQIGEHLEEMGRQARAREELRYPSQLEDEDTRMKWFNDLKYKNNPNFCYSHDDCVAKGYGFERYIYITGEWSRYGRGIYGFRNNKIAQAGYELTKCFSSKNRRINKDKQYENLCFKLTSKIEDMEAEYTRRNYGSGNQAWTIIEDEIFN